MPSEEKPPWVTTIPGQPEAFSPLSKEEAEKLALAAIDEAWRLGEGQGAQFLSSEQKFLLDAERRREHHKRNAELFANGWDRVEELKHRVWWAEAAIDLGKFDEAKAAVRGKRRRLLSLFSRVFSSALPKHINEYLLNLTDPFKGMPEQINQIQSACKRSDAQECKCEREVVETEKGGVLVLDRRFALRRIFSPVHNQIATIWKCRHCGFLNATVDAPTRQAVYETNRKQVESVARIAKAKGEAQPRGLSDTQILKA